MYLQFVADIFYICIYIAFDDVLLYP